VTLKVQEILDILLFSFYSFALMENRYDWIDLPRSDFRLLSLLWWCFDRFLDEVLLYERIETSCEIFLRYSMIRKFKESNYRINRSLPIMSTMFPGFVIIFLFIGLSIAIRWRWSWSTGWTDFDRLRFYKWRKEMISVREKKKQLVVFHIYRKTKWMDLDLKYFS
jgi:hypothetical protein